MSENIEKLNVFDVTRNIQEEWKNFVVADINDHVVRLSVLQRDFHWHTHDDSDEMFYVIQGTLFVDLEDCTKEIGSGEMITIPKGIVHRTRSNERTLLLCFEHKDNDVSGDPS